MITLNDVEFNFLSVLQKVCDEHIAPKAASIDDADIFPADTYALLQELGLVALLVPEEHGGLGASMQLVVQVYEMLAKASASCALIMSNSIEVAATLCFAQDELRGKLLSSVLDEGKIPCFAWTEPGAGSDALALETTARRHEGGYTLDGQKVFCTNGAVGDIFVIVAMTDPKARRSRRLTAFVVESQTPGFQIGRVERTLGTRGSPLTELYLDSVEVPADHVLLGEGRGLEVALHVVHAARIGCAAQCVGIGQDGIDRSLEYARQRRQFGQPIIEFQAVQLMIADMAIRTEASRQLTYAAAQAYDKESSDVELLTAMCKTLATDSAVETALDAIQVHGAYGYTTDFGVERLLRDAKGYQIFDGTNQIQRLAIVKALLSRNE